MFWLQYLKAQYTEQANHGLSNDRMNKKYSTNYLFEEYDSVDLNRNYAFQVTYFTMLMDTSLHWWK